MMPEGPEVRTVVQQLAQGAVGMQLQRVQFLSGRYDPNARGGGPPPSFASFFSDQPSQNNDSNNSNSNSNIIREWNAKGKFIYIILGTKNDKKNHMVTNFTSSHDDYDEDDVDVADDDADDDDDDYQRSIWITLGMTGRFVSESMNSQQKSQPRWVLHLACDDNADDNNEKGEKIQKHHRIYYHDPRNFGTIKFSTSRTELQQKLNSLGPDLLDTARTTEDVFLDIVANQQKKRKSINICKFLMNQKKISGIGNYILAEGLYRASIDPFSALEELTQEQQRHLFRALQDTAVASLAAQGMTRSSTNNNGGGGGGSYRDAQGNRGNFEFQLLCYGRETCGLRGAPVIRETDGPHGRTIWYTEHQLFMPRIMRYGSMDESDDDDDDEKWSEKTSTTTTRTRSPPKIITAKPNVASMATKPMATKSKVASTTKPMETKPSATTANPMTSVPIASSKPKATFAVDSYNDDDDDDDSYLDGVSPVEHLLSGLEDEGWKKALAHVTSSEKFKTLAAFIQRERRESGVEIYPPEQDVFAALNLCPLASVKVVIVGQDPYHGKGQGHGLAFSVRRGVPLPPSLKNIFKELHTDIPSIPPPQHGCLTSWAKQGVLLLNSVLTVRQGQPNSHSKNCGWEDFTDAIIDVTNQEARGGQDGGDDDDTGGIVYLLWGKPAHAKAASVDPQRHTIIATSHPSPLGASKTASPFLGSKCFSRANRALVEQHGRQPIDWTVQ